MTKLDSHDWTQTAWGEYGIASCLSGQSDEGLKVLRRVADLCGRDGV
jgi:hypothetical protein